MKALSLGVIGSGDIARTAHLPVLQGLEGSRLAWVADVDESRARALGKAYKVQSHVLEGPGESLPHADVVLLATPYGVRVPYYETYRTRGTALYVEKPLARTAEEHQQICSWFPEHALASGLMMRSWWANLMVRQIIDTGMFGPLRLAKFAHGRPGMVTYGRFYLDPSKGGGGMLAEFGIHGLDSMLFVTRARSASVQQVQTVWDGSIDLHTRAQLKLDLGRNQGVDAEILVTGIDDLNEGMELHFDHATLFYLLPGQGCALQGDTIDMRVAVRPRGGGPSYALSPRDVDVYPATKFQMFHHFWSQFLDGVREAKGNDTNANRALLTTTLLEDIARAGAAQREAI